MPPVFQDYHQFVALTTDFELEPVPEKYLQTYPDLQPGGYQIIFKSQDEWMKGDYVYIVIYKRHRQGPNDPGSSRIPELVAYIKSYCEVNNLLAVTHNHGYSFPNLQNIRSGIALGNNFKYKKI